MNLRLIVVLLALFGAAACSEPLEFADWTIPVPEGTEVFGYAPVPIDDRGDARIELVDDLVVRSRGDDERYLLYRPRDVDVGPDGSIYVLDAGDFNVKVYDAAGEHVRTFSQRGQGPGELSRPTSAAIAGDRYVVNDGGTRMIVWSLDGEYLGEHRLPVRPNARPFIGLDDGGVMIGYLEGRGDDIRRASDQGLLRQVFGRMPVGDGEPAKFLDLPETLVPIGRGPGGINTPLRGQARSYAASRSGEFYLTNGDEYQVLSLDTSGAARWALRVAWEREPYTPEEIELVLRGEQEDDPSVTRSDLVVADRANVVQELRIDGHGHIYVVLRMFVAPEDYPQDMPVDVFSADGSRRLFSGHLAASVWRAVEGDFVYQLRFDRDAGEQTLVRSRLVEPF